MYLAITESKKKVTGYDEDAQVTYEKHKIFLYKEDFEKFTEGLEDVIGFIKQEQGEPTPRPEYVPAPQHTVSELDVKPETELVEKEKENSEPVGETKRSFFDKFKF